MTRGTASLVVGDEHTAIAIGSGDVPALATPWLVALFERATVAAVESMLGPEETSVGVQIDIAHLVASAPGTTVVATAEIQSADDSRIICSVEAHAESVLVGRGTIVRARVHRERFVAGLGISRGGLPPSSA